MKPPSVPKLCGADIELGNFISGSLEFGESVRHASQALLAEITEVAGVSALASLPGRRTYLDPQDRERVFLRTNGGGAYIDLDHIEICLPEVVSAYDHVACWHAMLRLVQQARRAANYLRPDESRVQVVVNNSDGRGKSYGSHLNFLVSRAAWDSLIHRKPHYLAYLAAFQVSSLPISGQGKVGSENGAPPVDFQLSQRADFFETISGVQTTICRPLVNTRDEPHCGGRFAERTDLARAHVIFFDSTLCPVSRLLTVGTMQIVLAMIEAGWVNSELALDDPLATVRRWSHDPTLEARALLVSGGAVTALDLQRRFLDEARRFLDAGGCEGVVPRAGEIVTLWEDTLRRLEARDWDALRGRLDWVLKRSLLERACRQRPDLSWDSAELKHLDHLYSSLDPAEGLYWSFSERGLIEPVVSEPEIERFMVEPPEDTRAWGRTMLLRRARPEWIDRVDWDGIHFRVPEADGGVNCWRVDLPDPLGATRAELEATLAACPSFDWLLGAVGATRERPPAVATSLLGWPGQTWPARNPVECFLKENGPTYGGHHGDS